MTFAVVDAGAGRIHIPAVASTLPTVNPRQPQPPGPLDRARLRWDILEIMHTRLRAWMRAAERKYGKDAIGISADDDYRGLYRFVLIPRWGINWDELCRLLRIGKEAKAASAKIICPHGRVLVLEVKCIADCGEYREMRRVMGWKWW
jgi:hypothetical protein